MIEIISAYIYTYTQEKNEGETDRNYLSRTVTSIYMGNDVNKSRYCHKSLANSSEILKPLRTKP